MAAGDYASVIKYDQQAEEVYSGDPLLLLSIYGDKGIAYTELRQNRLAERYYRKGIAIAASLKDAAVQIQMLYNIARSEMRRGNYGAAQVALKQAIPLLKEGRAADQRALVEGAAAELAFRQGHVNVASDLIRRAIADAGTKSAYMPMADLHNTAYEVFKKLRDNEAALHHFEAYRRLDDQARSLTASANAALMSAKFDFANQDLKITRLRAGQAERDAAIARARARLHTTVTFGVLAAATVISTLLGIGFVSIRRSRNQVRAANATLRVTNTDLEKALAAKSEFLATTSHEIRTPLNGILGMTQVILADGATPGPLRERVQLIHGSGETMRALVDDILDVAKMETGELRLHPAEMDLRQLLDDAATMWTGQAESKRIAMEAELDDCPRMIVADEVRLRQVVFNLMSNAIKFTDRGHVRLTAACAPHGPEERLVIRVADSGIGIPEADLAAIFESFKQVDGGTTRRHGGTGLGLAICRNLARAMGGDVTVESIVGTGSTFTLDLPLTRAAEAPPPSAQASRRRAWVRSRCWWWRRIRSHRASCVRCSAPTCASSPSSPTRTPPPCGLRLAAWIMCWRTAARLGWM